MKRISRRVVPVLVLLAAARCAPVGPGSAPTDLPPAPPGGSTGREPMRAAITDARYAFAHPGTLAGRPDAAALAVAQVEYIARMILEPQFVAIQATSLLRMNAARRSLRDAFGIPAERPAALVIGTFSAASASLARGDRTAASGALARLDATLPVDRILAILDAMPAFPVVADALGYIAWDVTARLDLVD